eukprot:5744659-Amphidinium_carterae.1
MLACVGKWRLLYGRLFKWLVKRINETLGGKGDDKVPQRSDPELSSRSQCRIIKVKRPSSSMTVLAVEQQNRTFQNDI